MSMRHKRMNERSGKKKGREHHTVAQTLS